jgi:hypothetical protein
VLDRIREDLQHELPGIKGISVDNLKKMRIVAEAYRFFNSNWFGTVEPINETTRRGQPRIGSTVCGCVYEHLSDLVVGLLTIRGKSSQLQPSSTIILY